MMDITKKMREAHNLLKRYDKEVIICRHPNSRIIACIVVTSLEEHELHNILDAMLDGVKVHYQKRKQLVYGQM